jgi:alcohol dehydrogenase class IV
MATHAGRITDYMGQPGKIGPNVGRHIAIPTTSGTGSEVSRGAGIHPTATTRGNGINGPYVVPKVAICDPELTLTLPRRLTAATGMDALSHAVEGYLAKGNNPVGDAIALDSIRRVCSWLPKAVAHGNDREARWHMMMASTEAMLVAKGLGSGHALANTFGDQGLHHGTLVTLALPAVLRQLDAHVGDRMKRLAEAMMLEAGRHPAAGIADMNEGFGLPGRLRQYGYKPGDIDEMAAEAHKSFFNHTAPYHPTQAEYRKLIEELM